MKTIKLSEYNTQMGKLFILDDLNIYNGFKVKPSQILDNPSKYMDKKGTYFFLCENGTSSKRVVQILNVYGYKAIRVIL